ncbi:ABC transporter permease [Cesiribacter andamanensis]|uniref:Macrolide export ATP-binding/permease protein MacB n=1 Tax=Cesiribacter andamanensis AMV16 TaxID=1279009 RepID=M7MXF8_9BACT|nr:ABC transporter permease [Cesiribacter andamanensis]EMR01128.1 Macrolide export ATP-binding/permease protein MacB [Cesiribacter andamanensis AMV16]
MIKNLLISFAMALQNIRANFLHTLLSVLGIVIGVAALVAILSFIDGMEKYAMEQISSTTSLQSISIETRTMQKLDGIHMKKEEWGYFTAERMQQLEASLSYSAEGYLLKTQAQRLQVHDTASQGVLVAGTLAKVWPKAVVLAGRLFSPEEIAQSSRVALVNEVLASIVSGSDDPQRVLGQHLQLEQGRMQIIGVLRADQPLVARAVIPITFFGDESLRQEPPQAVVEAQQVEEIQALKAEIEGWLASHLARQPDDFEVITNEFRVEQMSKGILLFKIVMGLITGIAVLVGGIGIMNVLLISVTERTSEIGVRKAMGAKKWDILLQFLSESITVSGFGSFMGLVLGVLATLGAVPLIRHITQAPFEAAFTAGTLATVAILALVLGVVFGTYPAMRAARLDPVEAIRRE